MFIQVILLFNILHPLSSQTCQREIKKLKEKELKLGCELGAAGREITRLQALLKDLGTGQVSAV